MSWEKILLCEEISAKSSSVSRRLRQELEGCEAQLTAQEIESLGDNRSDYGQQFRYAGWVVQVEAVERDICLTVAGNGVVFVRQINNFRHAVNFLKKWGADPAYRESKLRTNQ